MTSRTGLLSKQELPLLITKGQAIVRNGDPAQFKFIVRVFTILSIARLYWVLLP